MQWKIFMCIKLFTCEYDRRCDYDSLFNYMFLLSLNKLDPFVFDLTGSSQGQPDFLMMIERRC